MVHLQPITEKIIPLLLCEPVTILLMYILATYLIYLITLLALVLAGVVKRPHSFAWSIAAIGSFLGLCSIFLWKLSLPFNYTYALLSPDGAWNIQYIFSATDLNWVFSISIAALLTSAILTSPAREFSTNKPISYFSIFGVLLIALISLLAGNAQALLVGWALLDLFELFIRLHGSKETEYFQNSLSDYLFRSAGLLFAYVFLCTNILIRSSNYFGDLNGYLPIFALILAAGFRIGIFPYRLRRLVIEQNQIELSSLLSITTVLTSLTPLLFVKWPSEPIYPTFIVLVLSGVAGLISAWIWLTESNNSVSQHHFMVASAALFIYCVTGGSLAGAASVAAGMALIGGTVFLHTASSNRLSILLACGVIFLIGLPFTISSMMYTGIVPFGVLFLPFFIILNLLLAGGTIRRILDKKETLFSNLPIWVQTIYPVGTFLGILILTLLGFWGWDGAAQIGYWWAGAGSALVLSIFVLLSWRSRDLLANIGAIQIDFASRTLIKISTILRFIYEYAFNLLEIAFGWLSLVLEGDGGWFWIGLFLVLIIIWGRGI